MWQEKKPFLNGVCWIISTAAFALIGLKTKHSLLNFGARCAMVWLVFTNGLTLRCGRTRCVQNLDQLGQLMTNATGWSHHRCLHLHCHHLCHHYHPFYLRHWKVGPTWTTDDHHNRLESSSLASSVYVIVIIVIRHYNSRGRHRHCNRHHCIDNLDYLRSQFEELRARKQTILNFHPSTHVQICLGG